MKTNLAALAALPMLLVAAPARADRWTGTDTVVQGVVLTTLVVDYYQTRWIMDDPITPGDRESNPVMGHRGQRLDPAIYFPAVAVLHTGLAAVLPQPYRRISQGVILAVQLDATVANWRAGYSFSF